MKEFTDLGAAVRSIFYSFADDALCKLTLQRNERILNRVFQSRNPDPKFRARFRDPDGYFWHPTSRAYF